MLAGNHHNEWRKASQTWLLLRLVGNQLVPCKHTAITSLWAVLSNSMSLADTKVLTEFWTFFHKALMHLASLEHETGSW